MKKFLLCLCLILTAAEAPAANASAEIYAVRADETKPGDSIVLNPETLRNQFLSNGLTVIAAANRVHKAKDNLNIARARLLPSLNLGVLLGTLVNPTFLISSIEYLFPFLIPSRWFDAAAAKNLMQAEKVAFLLAEMNIYSSVYSMYYQVLSDFETRDFLSQDLRDSILIENLVQRAYEDGRVAEADLKLAQSQSASSRIRLDSFEELLVDEIATLRDALALPLEKRIFLNEVAISPPALESMDLVDGVKLAKDTAPEYQQINFLIQAAKAEKWSKVFAFFSGASAGNTSGIDGGGASFAFKNQMGRGMFNFGFDYFPNLDLSNHNLDELTIRKAELDSEIARSVEALTGRVQYVLSRKNQASASVRLLEGVLENEKQRFASGEISLTTLLDAQEKVRQASLELLKSRTDLNLLRVALHRLTKSDQFALIPGCETLPKSAKSKLEKKAWRWPWEKDPEENPLCDPEAVQKRFGGSGGDSSSIVSAAF